MRTTARLVGWWLVLWGVWLLYVGQHHTQEVVAGAIAAALSTALAVGVARLARNRYRLDPRPLAGTWALPWSVVRDFAVVTLALARGRPAGAWDTIEAPVRGDDPRSAGRRALLAILASIAPNTYVVDLDRERGVAQVHNLDPRRARQKLL
jgi:multisubunit Na+/H+ antiporter MnhE subunit